MSLNGNSISVSAFLATRSNPRPTAPAVQRTYRPVRPVVPVVAEVARKYGPPEGGGSPPQRQAYEHSYLNDEPLSVATTRQQSANFASTARESPGRGQFMPTPPPQSLTPTFHPASARSPVHRVLPTIDGHSSFDGRSPTRVADPNRIHPKESQPSRPLASFNPQVVQPEASDDEYLSVGTGAVSGTTTEDFSIDQLAQMFGAARIEMDAANGALGPASTDPISLLMNPEETEDPRDAAFLEAWRDIVAHDQLESLRKRLCGFAGMARLAAVQCVHEIDAIAGGLADGTLNRWHVEYSVKRKDHDTIVKAIRDTVVAVKWDQTTQEAFDHLLVLLGKQCG